MACSSSLYRSLAAFCRSFGRIYSTSQLIGTNESYDYLQGQLEKNITNRASNVDGHFTQQLWRTLKFGDYQFKNGESHQQLSVTPEIITRGVAQFFKSLDTPNDKLRFFTFLAKNLGPDHDNLIKTSKQICDLHNNNRDFTNLLRVEGTMRSSLRPAYLELFSLMPRLEGGLQSLISIREELLSLIKGNQGSVVGSESLSHLHELDGHLRSVLSQWFSLGFLDLQRITWESPCDVIEKVSDYEAVHSVKHWKDIKHRVGPYRRVYIFTHRSMPREPIIILHTALTSLPSDSVQALLKLDNEEMEVPDKVKTAVFYSISAAHKGLSGIDLGNSLILQVVNELKKEFPRLNDFVTLSPIPGFRNWLESHLKQNIQKITDSCKISEHELDQLATAAGKKNESHIETLQRVLSDNSWISNRDGLLVQTLKQPLLSLCARYLVQEKRRNLSYNPVAHFHIRNGASVWRLNWLADVSPKGVNQSFGIMINYRYDLSDMVNNNIDYLTIGKVKYSEMISKYLH